MLLLRLRSVNLLFNKRICVCVNTTRRFIARELKTVRGHLMHLCNGLARPADYYICAQGWTRRPAGDSVLARDIHRDVQWDGQSESIMLRSRLRCARV